MDWKKQFRTGMTAEKVGEENGVDEMAKYGYNWFEWRDWRSARVLPSYEREIIVTVSVPTSNSDAAEREIEHCKILIADDNQANCELLEAYLVNIPCEIQFASDGQDTLNKIESFQPDLLLLDVMMPKLSGFEVCKQVKQNPATRKIMVLMVTALNELGDIERAVEAGTNDFLTKPVNRYALVKRVQNMLALKHVTDENERLRRYIERMEESA